MNGTFNEWIAGNGFSEEIETPEFLLANLEKWEAVEAYNQYAAGWARAMCTPFQWTKQVASHWGGTRNGTIVHWPRGINQKGEGALAVLPCDRFRPHGAGGGGDSRPSMVSGVLQNPYEGTSMLYVRRAGEPERHELQYFEILGNRGIYFQGWSAVTKHRTPGSSPAKCSEPSMRTCGALRRQQRLLTTRPQPGDAREAARAAAPVADRGRQVQRPAPR